MRSPSRESSTILASPRGGDHIVRTGTLVTIRVLPDVALEVLLEQPVADCALRVAWSVDACGLGEGHASAAGGGKVGRERALSR